MDSEFIFHIGYNKTGTTLLQQEVFPKLHSEGRLCFAGRWYREDADGGKYPPKINDLISKFTFAPISHDDAIALTAALREVNPARLPLVVSDEGMLRPFNVPFLIQNLEILNSMSTVRVLVTTRDEADLIVSRYQHDLGVPFSSVGLALQNGLKRLFGTTPRKKERWTLEEALVDESSCSYPYCRHEPKTFPCVCSRKGIKEISLGFYDFQRLEQSLRQGFSGEILFCKLLGPKGLCENAWRALLDFLHVDEGAVDILEFKRKRVNSSRRPDVEVSEETKERLRAHYRRGSASPDQITCEETPKV